MLGFHKQIISLASHPDFQGVIIDADDVFSKGVNIMKTVDLYRRFLYYADRAMRRFVLAGAFFAAIVLLVPLAIKQTNEVLFGLSILIVGLPFFIGFLYLGLAEQHKASAAYKDYLEEHKAQTKKKPPTK
jgi:hypothetical protein